MRGKRWCIRDKHPPLYMFTLESCVWFIHVQVKYKGDLKKLHKPVTDMAESLSMQHSLSTSKLSSQVRCRHPVTLPCSLSCWLSVGFQCATLWLTEACLNTAFPSSPLPQHNVVTNYWSSRGFMHLAPSYKHPSVCDFIWWWPLPFSPSWPSHADLTSP